MTLTVRTTGSVAIVSLSMDQVDGPAHVVVLRVGPGHSQSLPPHDSSGSLHETIDVEVARATVGAPLTGRARSRTDSGADPRGWEPLWLD